MNGRSKTALVVEKKTQTLYVYSFDGDTVRMRKMICSTGKGHGEKKTSFDNKTPEGMFFFQGKVNSSKKKKKSERTVSFQLDYPGSMDDENDESAKPLMFYGTNKDLKPMDTDGGIAVESNNIKELEGELSMDDTPVVIVDEIGPCVQENRKEEVEKIDRFLSGWAKKMSEGTYHEFLSVYSPTTMPSMSWWNKWQRVRKEAKDHGKNLAVNLSDRSVFKDGEVYLAIFRMSLKSDEHEADAGIRKLYIRSEPGGYRVVGDEFKRSMDDRSRGGNPLLNASKSLCSQVKSDFKDAAREEILGMLDKWAAAWSSGDMDGYAGFYSDAFVSSGLDKKGWIEKKKKLSSINRNIEISIEKPVLAFKSEKARVRFKENFKSSSYVSKGMKTLVLSKEGDRWMIIRENWEKK
jgi:murein L,D-transpeptidase YafK